MPSLACQNRASTKAASRIALIGVDSTECTVARSAPMNDTSVPTSHGTSSASTTRSEEHTSELQSLMRNSYAVFCLKTQQHNKRHHQTIHIRINHNHQRRP